MKSTDTTVRRTGRPLSFDREQALEQAMLTFWRHGYETSSISDLTAAMGITAPSLYTAYGDKKQLFLEAMRLYAGSPYDMEQALVEAPTSRDAAQRMLIAAAEAFTGELTPRGCLLASATASGSGASADVQSEVAQVRREIQSRLQNRIDRDVAQALLPVGTDSHSLATLVIALIQGMSVLARDGTDRRDLLAMANFAMNAWPKL
ncbi:TetR/AcrR family transcriptional regulator [Devosia psychrophila]|jgi:AcrR family transcriptional regulator|nr:TetR/AcrR family transcriptional regulator [Devosia psychrophila]KKC34827.1 TetR family transcriptional regulator [Devosia psychrophila]